MKRILAIDLGKFKSVSCLYRDETADAEFQTVPTTPSSIHDLLVDWRGQLHTELRALDHVEKLLADIEQGLDRLVAGDDRVRRLKTIPGVGNRLAELVVATLDSPQRFRSSREVGAYAGLVPRQFESGTMSRAGRITKQGPGLLRRLLVQIAWGMERRSARVKALFERISGGHKSGRKKAAVAIARKILIWCWAMLRDGTTWRELEVTA